MLLITAKHCSMHCPNRPLITLDTCGILSRSQCVGIISTDSEKIHKVEMNGPVSQKRKCGLRKLKAAIIN